MNIPAEYLTCTGVYLKMLLSSYLASPTPTGKNAGQRSLLGRREVQCSTEGGVHYRLMFQRLEAPAQVDDRPNLGEDGGRSYVTLQVS